MEEFKGWADTDELQTLNFTVIVADGKFPEHETPISFLKQAARIVCCDGSVANLILTGLEPEAIVGDMDSLPDDLARRFPERIFQDDDQETNDLTKSVKWCSNMGYKDIVIIGATGKREDHTLGNISLLTEYAGYMNVIMITDTGLFRPVLKSTEFKSFTGQQISVFSIDTQTEITSRGLKYPLEGVRINNWWRATLNEALSDRFQLNFKDGRIIVYLKFP